MTSVTPTRADVVAERSTHASTVGRMVLAATGRHEGIALRYKRGAEWVEVTYADLGATAREIARGLIALGIRPGDRVAILASTRPEWTIADCGAFCAGATVVPVYHTNSPGECEYVLAHSEARAVFCEDAEQLAKIAEIRDSLPDLEFVIAFGDASGDAIGLDELRARGADVDPSAPDEIQRLVEPDDIATIIYTSGTTGPPKGCMTTHRNLMWTVQSYEQEVDWGEPGDDITIFMFLPLAHSLTRVVQMVGIDFGATLAFWQGDAKRALEDILEAQPTHFPSVPRVFEKIHTKALAGVEESSRVKQAIFHWALATGRSARAAQRANGGTGPLLGLRRAVADKLVLSKVRGLFGDRIRLAMTGAAPISREVLEFFDACGVLILEGYGMTETTAASNLNRNWAFRFGTVGPPLPGADVALAEDGEILMRGPHVFAGYYKDDEATADTFDGEWLRSGDLGAVDDGGYLRITGRKKDLIITSSGKNITPVNIEAALRESRWISQAVVFGDNRPYLVALLTLDPDEAAALAARCGVDPVVALMASDPKVRAEIERVVNEANSNFARIEQVKKFAILDHDLSQAGGELTPTMKVKRSQVYGSYEGLFSGLYEA